MLPHASCLASVVEMTIPRLYSTKHSLGQRPLASFIAVSLLGIVRADVFIRGLARGERAYRHHVFAGPLRHL